ncbi:MAG: Dam family site-specific DNA-(adenine-N6)-methyltransferase [Candidatus Cloacimonetes bacterium]|jgi:DNA adenine methylase|nr:Dam family site-specific DNA-(adenine-N6)-methyltransferase [Candidatus Cloacimonadota bacterium]
MDAKPFVKWAGGKKYLLSELHAIIDDIESLGTIGYCEPMIGGGALYWSVRNKFSKRVISDINPELINLYNVIKDSPKRLITELRKPYYKYIHKSDPQSLETYQTIRASNPTMSVEKAARTMFLLRTCFNGLMRVNKDGRFNVPPGSYKNPEICNEELIMCDSAALQGTKIYCCGAITTIQSLLSDKHLIFLDPPYYGNKKFTDYSGEFSADDQTALIQCIIKSGQPFIYTNRAHPFIVNQFDNTDVNIKIVPLKHSVQPKYTTGVIEQELIAWRDGRKKSKAVWSKEADDEIKNHYC